MANAKISDLTPVTTPALNDEYEINQAGNSFNTTLKQISDFVLPTGLLMPWGDKSSGSPTGFLKCDGSAVSRTTYADLFAAIGTEYGDGDGSTTFNLPLDEYLTGWVSNSDWTSKVIAVPHGHNADADDLDIEFWVSENSDGSVPRKTNGDSANSNVGWEIQGVDSDNLQVRLQATGILAEGASFTWLILDTESWYYKITVSRKDVPKGSIIKI